MTIHEAKFETEAEAAAFVQGIELANDSALHRICGPRRNAEGDYEVYVHDEDGDEKATCPVCHLA